MHRSRLAGFIIDCETNDPVTAARFWSAALGMSLRELPGAEGEKYAQLEPPLMQLHIEVQAVDHASRVHLDIETDNIDAEIVRLEALGAQCLERVHTWCVMQAPTGQKFCVVRVGNHDFDSTANVWR